MRSYNSYGLNINETIFIYYQDNNVDKYQEFQTPVHDDPEGCCQTY